jgi:hypothetical protein
MKEIKKIKDLDVMHTKYKDFINVMLKHVENHMVHKVHYINIIN